MEAADRRHARRLRSPAGSPGCVPLVLLAGAIALFVALDAPGLERNGVPVEELAVERTVLQPGRDRAARAQRRPRPGRDQAGDRQRRLRRRSPRATTSSAGSRPDDGHGRRTRGSRARPTRSRCSPRPAGRSTHSIEVAAETPDADVGFYGLMALIGLYVGRDPGGDRDALAAVGAAHRPALGPVPAGADASACSPSSASTRCSRAPRSPARAPQAFGGAALVWLGAAVAYLALAGVDALAARAPRAGEAARGSRGGRGGWRCWSRSASACTTSARGWRSARPTRSARSRSAPR